jgi:hypothetical protein
MSGTCPFSKILRKYHFKKGSIFWQPNHQSRISFRLTAGVWCLFALVMVNVYSGTLTAHIMARKMSVPPGDSIEVMEKGVLAYLALDDGLGREFILVLRLFLIFHSADLAVLPSISFSFGCRAPRPGR